jgi:hypothetical protein
MRLATKELNAIGPKPLVAIEFNDPIVCRIQPCNKPKQHTSFSPLTKFHILHENPIYTQILHYFWMIIF